MTIRITQFGGPSHEFRDIGDYEQFLKTTREELVHLREEYPLEMADAIEKMWDRVYAYQEEKLDAKRT